MTINPEFKKHFDELESGHIALWQRLNAMPEKGPELLERLSEEMTTFEPWQFKITNALGQIAFEKASEQRMDHQQYIRGTRYHEIVQEAPFFRQIINKPEGYAGDAEMMRLIYWNDFEGNTPFGMLLHKAAVSLPACQAVRNRRTFLREEILELKNHGGGRILSVAAGPAMEIQDVLEGDPGNDTFHFHAFDHDIKTIRNVTRQCVDPRLSYVLGNAFHLIKERYDVAVPRKPLLNFCDPRKDFKGIRKVLAPVKYSRMRLKKTDYALVYSAGLYDYIKTFPEDPTKGTIALTKNLFELVRPGGALVIGNFNPRNPLYVRFYMEFVVDWQLIYRKREEMFAFARSIPEREIKSMEVLEEPLGINYFLKIDKTG
jgi:extracellular factor (EF) 3-hydroxypalmitic acid methyl ester biosynthesis protein